MPGWLSRLFQRGNRTAELEGQPREHGLDRSPDERGDLQLGARILERAALASLIEENHQVDGRDLLAELPGILKARLSGADESWISFFLEGVGARVIHGQ